MVLTGIKRVIKSVLISSLITSTVFLWPIENARADARVSLSQSFQSADTARANAYMDTGGTWNGSTELLNNGDSFTLSITNSEPNTTNANIAANTAYNISINLTLAQGIKLPVSPFSVSVSSTPLSSTSCPALGSVSASQSSPGSAITFSVSGNADIPPQCRYDFDFELSTNNQPPYTPVGNASFNYTVSWSNQDGTPANPSQSDLFQVPVRTGSLTLTKTGNNVNAVDGSTVSYDVVITNTGNGGLFENDFTDTIVSNLSGIQLILASPFAPPQPAFDVTTFTFDYLNPGQSTTVQVDSVADITADDTTCSIQNSASINDRTGQASSSDSATIPYDLANVLTISHDLANSYCELCGIGDVIINVANSGGVNLSNIVITEDLSRGVLPSGLIMVGPLTFNGTPVAVPAPEADGTYRLNIGDLDSPLDGTPSNPSTMEIRFRVQRDFPAFTQEGLADIDPADSPSTDLSIEATAEFDSVCGSNPALISTGIAALPLRQPEPAVSKSGWNIDAGQTQGGASQFVYGHQNDRVIWQVQIQNNGQADLEDLLVQDAIGGNFDFSYMCETVGDATGAATGSPGSSCIAINNLVASDFLPTPNPDVIAGGTNSVFYVGEIQSSCRNFTNTGNIQWGCEADNTLGGIDSGNSIILPTSIIDTADLNTSVSTDPDLDPNVTDQLQINVQITGTHPLNFGATNQPAGSRGRVTISIVNDTGGTVRNLDIENILPAQYVVDPSITANDGNTATLTTNNPQFDITMNPANGAAYSGMIDEVTWTNPVPQPFADPQVSPLGNTAPRFTFTSSSTGNNPFDNNLLRHGDTLTISFDIVLIDNNRYDLIADMDVREELAPGTDPQNNAPTGFNIDNTLRVTYEEACTAINRITLPDIDDSFNANPEDLDVDVVGADLNFILNTDDTITLPLSVRLTNNGGHDARNYFMVVSFGNAMKVDSAPANCTNLSVPGPLVLPRPYWDDPIGIPIADSPTVYQCDSVGFGAIADGSSVDFDFVVSRNAASTVDDLTFRADVVGEIQLSDNTPLIFPAVATTPGAQIDNVANNYSLDGIRARVVGFGLRKTLVGCSEQLSFPGRTPDSVFIGEDCEFNITSGGWFGFDTPGFGIIAVHSISVDDEIPTPSSTPASAQGFISQTDGAASDAEILNSGITFVPAGPDQLDLGTVSWEFNEPNGGVAPADNKLYARDKFFVTNITTRILNQPVDNSVSPNVHNRLSRNILNTQFSADFEDSAGNPGVFVFDQTTTGYPIESLRRYDLRISEPNLIVTKDVCNETLAGGTGMCVDANFRDFVNDGDTEDFYVYRIRLENRATTGVTRAPAYNVVISDVLDASDLMQVWPVTPVANPLKDPFDNDGLDNDGDGVIDEGDEALILTDNIVNDTANILPAQIKFSYTSSTALAQINSGEIVYLYYRVNPDDFIAPLQTLTNTLDVRFDTLEGLAGSQNIEQFPIDTDIFPQSPVQGSLGSARVYADTGETARVQISPLAVEPKIIVQTSMQPGGGPLAEPIDVVVGEEVEYKLRTLIPVANLRAFTVRDELPPGIGCIDVPTVNLNAPPYDAAGFSPGGVFSVANGGITCSQNIVEWRFGDQELTTAQGDQRFVFEVGFIGRVENTPTTQIRPFSANVNNCVLRNGGAATSWGDVPPTSSCNVDTFVRTSYRNDPTQGSILIEHLFDPIQVTVREPQLQITKTFVQVNSGNPGVDETTGDAKDIYEVRVDIENVGDANAYNPQILDNLQLTKYTYLGNLSADVAGNIPVSDAISAPLPGSNQPVFSWAPTFFIAPGAGNAISFTYRIEANDNVEPEEDVLNTIDAKWTSLQNNNIALNPSGAIAADGDVLGMRNGSFPNLDPAPVNPVNDYDFANTDSIVIPGLTVSKTDLDAATTLVPIGTQKRFQIDIDLPEGLTKDVIINDNLAFGDVAPNPVQTYVIENAAPFLVQYEFIGIRTINGVAPTPANAESIFNSVPANGTANNAIWNIGLVQTETEDDSALNPAANINPRIRITYYARVNNDIATNNNDLLRNQVELEYTNALVPVSKSTDTDVTDAVTVIEPVLSAIKVVRASPSPVPDAGDLLDYAVIISHAGTSTAAAYDLNIQDTLPSSVSYVANSAVVQDLDGNIIGTQEPTVVGQKLIWGRNNLLDDTLDIPLATGLRLTYQVQILNTVQPLEAITNSVVIDWTSIDGSSPEIDARERFGLGGDSCNNIAPNDYCIENITSTINVADTNEVIKTKSNDSFNLTPAGTDLRIGDIIEYTLTLNLQEGTTRGLTLVDTLSNGQSFLDVVSVNGQTTAPYTSANGFNHDAIAAPLVNGKVITWTIGSAANGIVNVANDGNDAFVIIYRTLVTKAEYVLPQVATVPINNTVVMDYVDVNGAPPVTAPLARLTSTVNNLNVQQPMIFLQNLSKVRRNGASVSGSPVVPNEIIDFRLEACNVGTAPAYNLTLEDVLPQYELANPPLTTTDSPLLDLATLRNIVVSINGVALTDGVDFVTTLPPVSLTNLTESLLITFNDAAPLPAGQCATLDFDIDVHNLVDNQRNWNNMFQTGEYYSLPSVDANAQVSERQVYAPQGPVLYGMNTIVPIINPNKDLLSPVGPAYEASIGQSITYQIRVPGDADPVDGPMQVNMFNVEVFDALSANVTLVNPGTDVVLDPTSQYSGDFSVSVSSANEMTINIPLLPFDGTLAIPGTQQAIFNVTVRVNNDANTSSFIAPITAPFGNSTNFSFGGLVTGIGTTANDVVIVEPQLTLDSKQGQNLTQADANTNAGDVILYTLNISSLNGAAYSDVFDVNIIDSLSPGLAFCNLSDGGGCQNPTISNGTSIAPVPTTISGDGSTANPYVLNWNSVNGSATDIDIAEGDTLSITYTVRVMDNVLANQQLTNTASISWTSLDGAVVGERDGLVANTPATHLYVSGPQSSAPLTVPDVNTLDKTLAGNTSTLAGANDVRVGDIVDFRLRMNLQEGTSAGTILTDTLTQGLQYEGIVSINGINTGNFTPVAPFDHPVYSQLTTLVSGDARTGNSVVTWTLGDVVNRGDNITTNDVFEIVYRTRVIDLVNGRDLVNPLSNIPLQNSIDLSYNTATVLGEDVNNIVNLQLDQPNLSITKSLLDPANTIIEADEVVAFYIDITNSGETSAYDLVLQDTLPIGLRMGTNPITITSIEMPVGTPITPRPVQTYDPATGIITWNFDTNTLDELSIPATNVAPAGDKTLRISYTVQADNNISAGLVINNLAQVIRYHSFDDEGVPTPVLTAPGIVPAVVPVREIYGPTAVASVPLTTQGPGVLEKVNPVLPAGSLGVSIGQPFDYLITVPSVAVNSSLYDVRILDDLSLIPDIDLIFVNVAKVNATDTFTPVNTGTPFNLVIEDVTNGIDVAPTENTAVSLSVMLRNTPNNVSGDTFINTADYTFNSVNNDAASQGAGMPGSSLNLTVVEPQLEVIKTGPATPVRFNMPIPYTVTIENTGNGPAYDTTITDVLPQVADNPPLTGGTCNRAPENVTAQIVKDDNSLVATLVQDTDFVVVHTPAPTCTFVVTTTSPLAVIQYDEKLVLTYDTYLDIDSLNGAQLTNNADVTQYFSQDTPAGIVVGEIREYVNDPNNPLDNSQYTVTVEAPELVINKVPYNVTTASDGDVADPDDVLRYTIAIQNNGPVATGDFSLLDIPDALNLAPGYFDVSTLGNVVVPAGAAFTVDTLTGTLNVTGLSLDALGGTNDFLEVVFEIQLIPVINSGTVVLNQGSVSVTGFTPQLTDDPSIVGAANPTETVIDAAPAFQVLKTSEDLTGDPAVLRQGDTLRYTLQVKNIGLESVTGAYLRDVVPANTRYVGNSTTLNGIAVTDTVADTSPLESEMLINGPEDTTLGVMRADADPNNTGNVATITFDVVVDLDVVEGTVVSNQAYVGGTGLGSGSFAEQASDNPNTSLANDPTINVVGNLPALDAQKTVRLVTDVAANGIVDTGDTLEYKIVISNGGAVAANATTFIDAIPLNSAYVANSFSLNNIAIPDAQLISVSPLTARINSSDLGLPDQAANDGQISAGNEASILFRVVVTGPATSVISNQGRVISDELPEQFTDSDGNSLNGSQPTDTIVGANSELQITKEVYVVGGGVAEAGGELEYIVTVSNTGLVNATNVMLVDVIPGNVTFTSGSTKLDGSTSFIGSGVAEPGVNLTVNYQLAKGVLEAGEKFTVSYRVVSDAGQLPGTEILNTATVSWTEQNEALSDDATIEIGGAPGVGVIGGHIWHDIIRSPVGDFTDGSDINLANWTVQVYLNNPSQTLFASALTDADGRYQFKGLPTSSTSGEYELRILPPGGSDRSASMGPAIADAAHGSDSGISGEMLIRNMTVVSGSNIANQNMPVIPTGVIYDTVFRTPVAGATLRLLQANGSSLPTGCLPVGSNQETQTSSANGFYRFDIQAASCNVSNFLIEVNSVPGGYTPGASRIIPAGKAGNTNLDVAACSRGSTDDTIPGNNDCDIQFSVVPPDTSVPVRTDSTEQGAPGETQGTTYYLSMRVTANGQVAFNNHIPLDPELTSAISITKISPMVNVTRSQLVPYTITMTNNLSAPLYDLDLADYFPAGFKYIAGSGRIQFNKGAWVKTEPVLNPNDPQNLTLTWANIGRLNSNESYTVKLLLVVGSGVSEGEYVNRARVLNNLTGGFASPEATATVRVVPDPTFDCSDVIGKIFDDKNLNAYQDEGEEGIPGVRVMTARGLEITADAHGRFHVTCAVVPNQDRGSNFILKLDERSLPSGYRLTTENPRVVRATRGKMIKFNFGAAIHRVVRLDMADQVFEPESTKMRPQWLPRLDLLITELAKDPSLLRLSYLADNETESLVSDRLDSVKDEIEKRWEELDCCYQLTIETEVFWRKGAPVDRGAFDD